MLRRAVGTRGVGARGAARPPGLRGQAAAQSGPSRPRRGADPDPGPRRPSGGASAWPVAAGRGRSRSAPRPRPRPARPRRPGAAHSPAHGSGWPAAHAVELLLHGGGGGGGGPRGSGRAGRGAVFGGSTSLPGRGAAAAARLPRPAAPPRRVTCGAARRLGRVGAGARSSRPAAARPGLRRPPAPGPRGPHASRWFLGPGDARPARGPAVHPTSACLCFPLSEY